MDKRSIRDRLPGTATGKRVFVRVDFNVPLDDDGPDHRRHAHPGGAADDPGAPGPAAPG